MWKLVKPDDSQAMDNIDTAFTYVSGKQKYSITPSEKSAIKKLYDKYELLSGASDPAFKGGMLRSDLLDALYNSYGEIQKTGRLKKLRSSLLANARRCPSCGILPVDELDHYLPKAIYKTLAIYPRNIVPYCHVCNKFKLAAEGTIMEERFIHSYYDVLPEVNQFLFANVWIEGEGLQCTLEIRKIEGLSDLMVKRLNFQMSRVNLEERVIGELFDFLIPTATAMKENFELGGAILLQIYLKQTAKHLIKAYGLNDWRPVIMAALADCNEFCNGGFYNCLSL